MRRLFVIVFVSVVVSGCNTPTRNFSTPSNYYEQFSAGDAAETLFSGDAAVLSNAEIERILAYRYEVPTLSRIALLPSGWAAWGGWSEEMTVATEAIDKGTLAVLRASPLVYDAAFLPSILVPEKRTVPYLREAGARFQADLLLAYKTACRSFERYRLFASDQTRAYCTVEAVLLDVRTGLVPFTATSSQSFNASKTDQDLNTREAILRAQLSAVSRALGEISERVVVFLEAKRDG